jgi:hypothetical protein
VPHVRSDAAPGAIRAYDKSTLLCAKLPPRLSPHDPAVGQCLAMEIADCGPREVLLTGIVPVEDGIRAEVIPAGAGRDSRSRRADWRGVVRARLDGGTTVPKEAVN